MDKFSMRKKLFEIYIKYPDRWVALNQTKDIVIASGKNIGEVIKKLEKSRKTASEIRYITPLNKSLAPVC